MHEIGPSYRRTDDRRHGPEAGLLKTAQLYAGPGVCRTSSFSLLYRIAAGEHITHDLFTVSRQRLLSLAGEVANERSGTFFFGCNATN